MVESYTNRINAYLQKTADKVEHVGLKTMLNQAIHAGGKRIRPALCLMACEMFLEDEEAAMAQAVALELFHTFSLVHDDIMDEAPIRRGQASIYFSHGRDKAILGGDVILILAFDELLQGLDQKKTKAVLRCFADIAVKVCEGQMMDMDFEGTDFPSQENYMKMIELKTSVLIGASLKIGGIVGGASFQLYNQLYDFGVLQGLAFQIQDDILDAYGDQSLVGKRTGGDIIQGKKTILTILCAEKSQENGGDFERMFYDESLDETTKIKNVMGAYKKYNIFEAATALKKSLTQKATEILKDIEVDENSKKKLQYFSEWLMNRSY